jgi:hypothetical protein
MRPRGGGYELLQLAELLEISGRSMMPEATLGGVTALSSGCTKPNWAHPTSPLRKSRQTVFFVIHTSLNSF